MASDQRLLRARLYVEDARATEWELRRAYNFAKFLNIRALACESRYRWLKAVIEVFYWLG